MRLFSISIVCFLISQSLIHAQSLENLDRANGIKAIKLDAPYSSFASNLTLSAEEANGNISYKHKNASAITFHNSTPETVLLDFYKGKLYGIMMFFNDEIVPWEGTKGSNAKRLLEEFELIYGKPTLFKTTLTNDFFVEWKGTKVKLLTQYFKKDKLFCVEFRSMHQERQLLIDNN